MIHADERGEGPPVVLLHGLFGAGNNLGGVARSLDDRFRVLQPDLPNHGRSGWTGRMDIPALAGLLDCWLLEQSVGRAALVGHSLGGKVAMQLALAKPQRVGALVVVDIAPAAYPPRHDAVLAALEEVQRARVHSRAEAGRLLAARLEEERVIQFLLTSLRRQDGGEYDWRFNLAAIRRDYDAISAAVTADASWDGPALFIRGAESDYIAETHRPLIAALFPQAELAELPDCGHWPHADQPERFNRLVGGFLDTHWSGAAA